MRASAGPDPTDVVVVRSRRLPRPVVWLLWLLAALAGSVVVGFLAGLARPREPEPWTSEPPPGPSPASFVPETATSVASPLRPEDD